MTEKNQTPDISKPSDGTPAADDGLSTAATPAAHAVVATGEPVMVETSRPSGRPGEKPASSAPPPTDPPVGGTHRADERGKTSPNFAWLVVGLVLLCLALAAAIWWQRQAANHSGMAVAARLDTLSTELAQSRRDAREALALAQSQTGKVAALETAVRENQAEYSALEQAWQDFNDTTNDGVLANDVERLVTIASQQLRFGGSVNNAIVALEAAQSRLARADRPRFVQVQQAINGDLDRLRAVPVVDVAAQTTRIDRLTALVGRAPLLVPDTQARSSARSAPQPAASAPVEQPAAVDATTAADVPWWQRWRAEVASWPARAGGALAHEMGDLIRVQRVDQPEALLLTGDQAGQLRGVLRQRLQTAQLALLMRQAPVWQSEIAAVSQALNDYFDPQSADTQAALRMAESLAATQVVTSLPDLSDSLDAMAAARTEPTTTDTGRN